MKYTLLFLAGLLASLLTFAQTSPARNSDHIRIIATNDSLTVRFKNKSFKLNKIQDLDSCLRNNLPDMTLPVVDLEADADLTAQNHCAIINVTDKYRIPVTSQLTISNGKLTGSVKRVKFDR